MAQKLPGQKQSGPPRFLHLFKFFLLLLLLTGKILHLWQLLRQNLTKVKFRGATIGAAIGAVSWIGGAVKIFRTKKFWKRAILKYNKNFSILFIEDERGSNK